MNKIIFLKETKNYKSKLDGILERFTKGREGWHIEPDDGIVLQQIVLELMDFFTDNLVKNTHASQIQVYYNDGKNNHFQSPSYRSVENIIGVVKSVITRVNRNPGILNSKKKYPLKLILKTLIKLPYHGYGKMFMQKHGGAF